MASNIRYRGELVVQEKDTAWFIKFCVPWCKHCKNLGTLWEDLGKEMEGEDEVEIGEVDCATHKPVCSKVDIHSYPTFKLFYNGEEVSKYQACPITAYPQFFMM
ncbi:UNVERIFIED_CONTAM: protein disulfide isomerase-like 5-1 [Sesamum radiatum]|uniref:Protein disulfide isomerase-like 5-1 n=1 Tax=Sesamum radiatum TaxID=300843 RepID=A0AAW2UNY6_SESRA